MKRFRQILFWIHLGAGLIAGLFIGIMCVTGTALAFENEIVAWAERDARRIEAPASGTSRLSIEEIASRLRNAFPDAKPGNIVMTSDPHAAVAFTVSRAEVYYANPYTGEIRQPQTYAVRRFMQTMFEWHRYLGFSGENTRPTGKLATGIANLAFCFLGFSGLVLWWPRSLSWRAFRPSIWFTQNSSSRVREWNWHTTLGFWCAPVLITLTLTAMPISFRWAAELTYSLTNTPLPASGPQSSGAPPPAATVPSPAEGTRAVSREELLATVRRELPAWQTVTFRFAHKPDPAKPSAASFTVREARTWPRTATTTLQFDPFSGALLQRDGYADLSAARKVRAWTRYLHTGQALGWPGQLVAGVGCLGGCFLVYTGFALSWRRFFGKKSIGQA